MTPDSPFAAPVDPDRALHALDDAVTAATTRGRADQVEVCLLGRAGEYTRFAGDRIHQAQDVTEVQLLVRAVVAGHAARTATTVLGGLDACVARATLAAHGAAAAAARAGTVSLAAAETDPPEHPRPSVWFDDVVGFDAAARSELARHAMRQAVAVGGQAAGMLGRAVTQQVVATSSGVRRATLATEATGSLTVGVEDGTAHWVDLGRCVGRLGIAEATRRTVEQATTGRGRRAVVPGRYTVVLGPEAVGELLRFLPAFGFAGDLAADGIGVCVTRRGERVAAPLVTVADDSGADVGLPLGFDIEGTSRQKVVLLDRGRVGDPVTDRAVARVLGTRSTGHAHIAREQVPSPEAANVVLAAGDVDEVELIAGVDRGVYIQRFWYTRLVDREASTITGVTRDACFLIEDGRLTHPLSGTRFTQSVLGFLDTVDAVGRDVRSQPVMNVWNGATSAPAVRGHGFRLGVPDRQTEG